MKKQIQEVQEYFKNKIVKGDFEIIKIDEYNCSLKIDDEYIFMLWISNGVDFLRTNSNEKDFMPLTPFSLNEKQHIYSFLEEAIEYFRKNEMKKNVEFQIKELNAKLKKL